MMFVDRMLTKEFDTTQVGLPIPVMPQIETGKIPEFLMVSWPVNLRLILASKYFFLSPRLDLVRSY